MGVSHIIEIIQSWAPAGRGKRLLPKGARAAAEIQQNTNGIHDPSNIADRSAIANNRTFVDKVINKVGQNIRRLQFLFREDSD